MATSRRKFLQAYTAAAAFTAMPGWVPAGDSVSLPSAASQARSLEPGAIDTVGVAKRHAFVKNSPTPDFFEGMLLGNGGVMRLRDCTACGKLIGRVWTLVQLPRPGW